MKIEEIDYACIFVGKNNTGKTVILDAIRAITGSYQIKKEDFFSLEKPIEIEVSLEITEEDLKLLFENRIISKYKNYEQWMTDFQNKLPTFQDNKLDFIYIHYSNGRTLYQDKRKKSNKYIPFVLPKICYIGCDRNISEIEKSFLPLQTGIKNLNFHKCIFTKGKDCTHCFQCRKIIENKKVEDLTAIETAKLLEYKLYLLHMGKFLESVNQCFQRNTGKAQEINYQFKFDIEEVFHVETLLESHDRDRIENIEQVGAGTKSLYILSLLEAYIKEETSIPSIVMMEEPEIYLHPQLQKAAGEVLYKLSKKNQVIFSTHSPNMLFNFSTRQIKQVILDRDYYTVVREGEEIDDILDDLGYTANDLMNVSFVFIVEGKQDRNRLPLLLEKYYSEIYDESGKLQRISIITTNKIGRAHV